MKRYAALGELAFDDFLLIFLVYVAGMLGAALIGNSILSFVGIEGGTGPYIVYSPLLAAFLEPLLTKLAPASVLVYWVKTRREDLLRPIQNHPFLIGSYGGGCVGIVEAVGKLSTQSGMYAGVSSITMGVIVATLGHVLYGGIVGNAVYRDEGTRWWHNTITATLLAILIHFSWNGYQVIELLKRI